MSSSMLLKSCVRNVKTIELTSHDVICLLVDSGIIPPKTRVDVIGWPDDSIRMQWDVPTTDPA